MKQDTHHVVLVSETEAKLVKNLPHEPDYGIEQYEFKKKAMWQEHQREVQQAIDSSPFIKNFEIVRGDLLKAWMWDIKISKPYLVDLTGYEVSEPEATDKCVTWCGGFGCLSGKKLFRDEKEKCTRDLSKKFVTISPKQDKPDKGSFAEHIQKISYINEISKAMFEPKQVESKFEKAIRESMENSVHAELTRDQKLLAIKLKYYDGLEWNPKKGDYYTSSRNDLELYQIVDEDENYFMTNYCNPQQTTPNPAQWLKTDFKKGFGEKRIYVPEFVFSNPLPTEGQTKDWNEDGSYPEEAGEGQSETQPTYQELLDVFNELSVDTNDQGHGIIQFSVGTERKMIQLVHKYNP